MISSLHEFMARLVPSLTYGRPRAAHAYLHLDGKKDAIDVLGAGPRMVQVLHDSPPMTYSVGSRTLLTMETDDGTLRIDLPVEVASSTPATVLLRMLGVPLVLRRRLVHDRALEEAVGRPG